MIGRRMVTVGVAVAAVTVGGVAGAVIGIPGLSGASSSPSLATAAQSSSGGSGGSGGPHIRGSFGRGMGASRDVLDAAAKALHLSTQDLLQKLSDGKTTIADVAKAQNVKLQDVIDAMAAVAKSDISKIVNSPFPTRPHFPGKGFGGLGGSGGSGGSGSAGPSFPHVPMIGGLGFGIRGALNGSVDAIAKALGISSSDLRTDLRNGQSIADIAKSKKVDLNKVIDTLVDDAKAKIDAAAKDGHLPKELATKLEAGLKEMITNAVNNSSPKGFGGIGGIGGFESGGRRGGHRGGPMMPNVPMPAPESAPSN